MEGLTKEKGNIQGSNRAYEEYLSLIRGVVQEVNEMVEGQQAERERALAGLESLLAHHSLRRSDFKKLAQRLLEIQLKREEEMRGMLREFLQETQQLSSKLCAMIEQPDPKKMKKLVAEVEEKQRGRTVRQGKLIEELLGNLFSKMQQGLEEFRNERMTLNQEWVRLQEEKERLTLLPLPS